MTLMLSDMFQASLSKFASQFNPSSGGQGDSAPAQAVASEPTTDVASNYGAAPQGPEDQCEGEIIESQGDPADAGLPILDNLKCLRRNSENLMISLWPQYQYQCLSDLGGPRGT